MSEDKKKKIVELNRGSITKHGDEITTTQHTSPDVTREVTQHWRFKDDGTENTPLVEQYNANVQRIGNAYGVDPNTGKVDKDKFLSGVLGLRPEEMRQKRDNEIALNRAKQKESAIYNALAVLGDMVTTAGGGNVWQRQPNKKAKEAADRNLQLEREQLAEDAQNNQMVSNAQKAYDTEVAKLQDAYQKAYGGKLKITTKGDTQQTKQRGDDVTEATIEQQLYPQRRAGSSSSSSSSSSSGGGGGKTDKFINYNEPNSDGSVTKNRYPISKEKYLALQGILIAHYNNILKKGDESSKELKDILIKNNVITKTKDGKYVYNKDQLLQSGEFPMLDEATIKRIENDVPGLKFRHQNSKGWGVVPPQTKKPLF